MCKQKLDPCLGGCVHLVNSCACTNEMHHRDLHSVAISFAPQMVHVCLFVFFYLTKFDRISGDTLQ